MAHYKLNMCFLSHNHLFLSSSFQTKGAYSALNPMQSSGRPLSGRTTNSGNSGRYTGDNSVKSECFHL
jgi:hypothetical protein